MYQIGRIDPKDSRISTKNSSNDEATYEKLYLLKEASIKADFETLRKVALDMGYFKPSYFYFMFQFMQIVSLQILGYYILWTYGYDLLPLSCSSLCLILAQVKLIC